MKRNLVNNLCVTLVSLSSVLLTALPMQTTTAASAAMNFGLPFHGHLAVMDAFTERLGAPQSSRIAYPYHVLVVDRYGRIVARAASTDTRNLYMPVDHSVAGYSIPGFPVASVSDDYVYYVDGGATVRVLNALGQTRPVATIPSGAATVSAFSISPDDRRMAVTELDYTAARGPIYAGGPERDMAGLPVRERLYVQDLASGRRHELYTTTLTTALSDAVWPVAWTSSALVLAAGPVQAAQGVRNPYQAVHGYHLVSWDTGERVAALCAKGWSLGPLVPSGALCLGGSYGSYVLDLQQWSGHCAARFALPADVDAGDVAAAASPDGSNIVLSDPDNGRQLIFSRGTLAMTLHSTRWVIGWIDSVRRFENNHVASAPIYVRDAQVWTLATVAFAPDELQGGIGFVGTLPGGLGAIVTPPGTHAGAC